MRRTARKARMRPPPQCQKPLVGRGHTTAVALGEKLRRVIDPDRQRLETSHGHDVHRREQLQLDRHRHVEAGHDRGESRVLGHVFRILLIMLIWEMTRIGVVMRMMRLGRGRIVVMHEKPAKRLMRMSHC